MNHDTPTSADSITLWSRRLLLFSATYVVACIPAILIAEAFRWPQRPFHTSQLFMSGVCFVSATTFWFRTRGNAPTPMRAFALVAMLLSAAWLAFVAFVYLVLLPHAFDGM